MRKKVLCALIVAVMLMAAVSASAAADNNWSRLTGSIKSMAVDAELDTASAITIADGELGTEAPTEGTESVIYKCEDNLYYRIVRGEQLTEWQDDATGYSMSAVSGELDEGDWYVIGTYKQALVIEPAGDMEVCAFEGDEILIGKIDPVSGEAPYSYTWHKNEIVCGTGISYTVTSATKEMDGDVFCCEVQDNDGSTATTGNITLKVLANGTMNWNEISKDTGSVTVDSDISESMAKAMANKKLGGLNTSTDIEIVVYAAEGEGYSIIARAAGQGNWNENDCPDLDTLISALSDARVYVIGTAANDPLVIKSPTKETDLKVVYKTGSDKISLTVGGGRAPYHYVLEGAYVGGEWQKLTENTSESKSYSLTVKDFLLSDNEMQLRVKVTDANGVTVTSPITTIEVTVPYTITGNYFKPYVTTEDCVLTICKDDKTISKSNLISVSFAGTDITADLLAGKNGSIKEGSLIITLNKAYLRTLKLGTYKLIVKLGDSANPVVINETVTVSNVPKTSDNTHIVSLSALLVLCAGAAIIAGKKRRFN